MHRRFVGWKMLRRVLVAAAVLSSAGLGLPPAAAQSQGSPFADSATQHLIDAAQIHHRERSADLVAYRADVLTKLEARFGSSRFARGGSFVGYQSAARLHWTPPNSMRIDVLGARSKTPRLPGLRRDGLTGFWTEVLSSEPWFSPAPLGDEIQLMGTPDQEALHPLAHDGPQFYRYWVEDSTRITTQARSVRLLVVRVEPLPKWLNQIAEEQRHRALPDDTRIAREGRRLNRPKLPTLVAGRMWIDADSLDVARMAITFVGADLGEDDPDAPVLAALEADLEYALVDERYWLPHRQVLTSNYRFKYFFGADLAATAVTTFSEYDINVAPVLALGTDRTDSVSGRFLSNQVHCEPWEPRPVDNDPCEVGFTRRGGSDSAEWEITAPPTDSLERFDFGSIAFDPVVAEPDFLTDRLAELADLTHALPQRVIPQIDSPLWTRLPDAFRFNRVTGPAFGNGLDWEPGIAFTTIRISGQVGAGDERAYGSVTIERDAPRGRLSFGAARDLRRVEPWSDRPGLGTTLKAVIAGHDDADYYLSNGGFVTYTPRTGPFRQGAVHVRIERALSVETAAGSALHDAFFGNGDFPVNPSIIEGTFVGASLQKTVSLGLSGQAVDLGVEGLAGRGLGGGRAFVHLAVPLVKGDWLGRVRSRVGAGFGDRLPQLDFRLGGPETVRGYAYGAVGGRSLWSLQLDVERTVSPWWSPFVLMDVGGTFDGDPLVGVGAGVSFLSGWSRIQLAKGLNPSRAVRADVLFQIPAF